MIDYQSEIEPVESGKTDAEIADAINVIRLSDNGNLIPNTFVTERGVYAELGTNDGEAFLASLEAASADNATLARVTKWLEPGQGGIDVGNPETATQIDALVLAGVLDEESAHKIRNIGLRQKLVSADDVAAARSTWQAGELERRFEAAVIAGREALDNGDDAATIKAAIDAAWGA